MYKDTPMQILRVVKGGMDQSNRSDSVIERRKPVRMDSWNGKGNGDGCDEKEDKQDK